MNRTAIKTIVLIGVLGTSLLQLWAWFGFTTLPQRGQFGDMFGLTSSVLSGLALLLLTISTVDQRVEVERSLVESETARLAQYVDILDRRIGAVSRNGRRSESDLTALMNERTRAEDRLIELLQV